MTKHQYNEFPSDMFLILETVGAQLQIARGPLPTDMESYTVAGFLQVNMNKRVLVKIILPALDSDKFTLKTYKVSE